jgi:hypothetical protein
MTTRKNPQPKNMAAYRARLSCKIGMDAIGGVIKPPAGVPVFEYALYNLFRAIEDVAMAIEEAGK